MFSFFGGIIKTLSIDLESTPNLAHVWSLWNNNVSLAQLRESSELLCFSAKWLDDDNVMFFSDWDHGQAEMVRKAHELLSEADVVMHFNGLRFDIPYLNKEFLLAGYSPPEPFQQIDLYRTVRQKFKFPSNKLAYVSKALGLEGKVEHEGHELWVKVMAGDQEARDHMREYNIQDTILVEQLYYKLRPWVSGHPNKALIDGRGQCTHCGSDNVIKRGFAYTVQCKFQRLQCLDCGKWFRETRRVAGHDLREVA